MITCQLYKLVRHSGRLLCVCVYVCVCLSTMTNEQIAAAWTYIQSTSLHHCHHHCVFNFLYCLSTFSWIKPDPSRWLLPYVHFTANVKAEWNVTLFCPVWKLTHTGICWQAWFSDPQGSLSKTAQEYRRGRMKTYLWLSPFRRQQGQGWGCSSAGHPRALWGLGPDKMIDRLLNCNTQSTWRGREWVKSTQLKCKSP